MVKLSASPVPAPTLTLDEVVRELQYLPSAPRVLPRLKQLLCDGNTAMNEVVEMVRLDPGIAARVLQFGNSAHFSQGLRCYTVEEAVNRVGYDQIYELVATAVASQVLVRPLASYNLEADDLWENSIACALAAEALSSHVGTDRNISYTVGLLHSVGMVAIDAWVSRHQPTLHFVSKGLPLESCEQERSLLGFHQAEAGAGLLRAWEFPSVMFEPVRWQYLPNGTAVHFKLAALLHIAKWIRATVLRPADNQPRPHGSLLASLQLTNRQLESLVEEVGMRFKGINIRLEDTTPTFSVRFPGGERQISQGFAR